MRILSVFLILFSTVSALAQSKVTLNGYIRDSATGESVIGATISVVGQQKAVASNQYGFFSITLDTGTYTFSIAHVSYLIQMAQLQLKQDTSINFSLFAKSAAMNEVVVYSRKRDVNVVAAQMGK